MPPFLFWKGRDWGSHNEDTYSTARNCGDWDPSLQSPNLVSNPSRQGFLSWTWPHPGVSELCWALATVLSLAEGLQRDTQYIFSVPESMEDNNVVVSFNVMPQNLKAENEGFPLNFQVFKVREIASGPAHSGHLCITCEERAAKRAGRLH